MSVAYLCWQLTHYATTSENTMSSNLFIRQALHVVVHTKDPAIRSELHLVQSGECCLTVRESPCPVPLLDRKRWVVGRRHL